MALKEHFEKELEIMRKSVVEEGDELIIEPFVEQIREIINIFSKQGHSGGSAPFAIGALSKTIKAVLGFQILSPLTGEDSEWRDVSEMNDNEPMWQNLRDSSVFKDADGNCSYNSAIVWKGEDTWDTFTGGINGYRSSNYIKEFPFMPRTYYVDVTRELYDENNPEHKTLDRVDTGHGEMIYKIKDPKQLEEVFNYYNQRTNEKSV